MADTLVVTSKVKKFIKDSGNCNTSSETIAVLKDMLGLFALMVMLYVGLSVPGM